jgi:acyl-CoA thioesterase I
MLQIARFLKVLLFFSFLSVFGIKAATAQIVALGASNVEGYGVSASEAFPAQLEAILRSRGKTFSVAAKGVYGDTTAGVLERLDSDIPTGTRFVVLAIGGNDVRKGGTAEEARANVALIIGKLQGRGIKVVNAMPFLRSAIQSGMVQSDGRHLNAEGHRFVATHVAALI